MKEHDETGKSLSKTLKSFISGGIAGVVSKTIIAPIERVKYLFIVYYPLSRKTSNRVFTYRLFFSDFKHIVKTHGILNLWRGNLLNVARVFPHAAIVPQQQCRIFQLSTLWGPNSTKRTALQSSKSFYFCAERLQVSPHSPSQLRCNS